MIHRRVRVRPSTDAEFVLLRLIRNKDKVEFHHHEDGRSFVQPNSTYGLSVYSPCNHGTDEHGTAYTKMELYMGWRAKRRDDSKRGQCFICYSRPSFPSNEYYRLVSTPLPESPAHHDLCPQQPMQVEEKDVDYTGNYYLPVVPLLRDTEKGDVLWKPCCLLMLLKVSTEHTSLDSDNDAFFLAAVLDVVVDMEYDWESCKTLTDCIDKLMHRTDIATILRDHEALLCQSVDSFRFEDIRGGMYNKRALSCIGIHALPR